MATTSTIRVADLAKELGLSDRDLIAKAAEHEILLTAFSRLDADQATKIRKLLKPKSRQESRSSGGTRRRVGSRTVVRRRVRRDEAGEPPAADPAAEQATAPPAEEPQSASTTTTRRRIAAGEDRPKIRRVKADELNLPPDMQPKTMITAEEQIDSQIEAAGKRIAAERRAAEQKPAQTESKPSEGQPAEAVEVQAPSTDEPAVVEATEQASGDSASREEQSVDASAADASQSVDENLELNTIGKAIEQSDARLPSERKVPRLKRLKMPEVLVNIPKPPKPKPSPESSPRSQPDAKFDRHGRSVPGGGGGGGGGRDNRRGRKVIYDRHQDSGRFEDRRRGKKRNKRQHTSQPTPVTVPKAEKRILKIEETISVANLAKQMSVKATEVIRKLFDLGIMATINHTLDMDTIELVAADFGFTVQSVAFDLETFLNQTDDDTIAKAGRAPVITVMGHVDHGKTSLLDQIRSSRVAVKEAGGITQHIGAYKVETNGGREVVFLDTPGHEAFTAMRARGAKATDVVVLVVAADDGVMPQTIEAINHGKAADVPLIVAINKMDKVGADVERVRRELAENNVVVEEWGGDVSAVEVSAKTGQGVDDLLELLALQAEVMELEAATECDARGLVIEARLERGRGAVATLLVQKGTLHKGDYVVAGEVYGRVRAMMSDRSKELLEAGPSTPVEVTGLSGIAASGDQFYVTPDEKSAKAIVDHRVTKAKERKAAQTTKVSLDNMFEQMEAAAQKDLNIIIKADVHGSAEALKQSLQRLVHADVKVRVLHCAVGGVTESDIQLAAASGAMILAFNVKPENKGKRLAEDMDVEILPFSVIYDAIDHVMAAMEGLLEPIIEEVVHGHAEVRAVFHIAKAGSVAGCYITDGKMFRNQRMRLTRGEEVLWQGGCSSLKRFKDDVPEVATGYECGISLEGFGKFREGDQIECFEIKKTPRKLELPKTYRPTAESE